MPIGEGTPKTVPDLKEILKRAKRLLAAARAAPSQVKLSVAALVVAFTACVMATSTALINYANRMEDRPKVAAQTSKVSVYGAFDTEASRDPSVAGRHAAVSYNPWIGIEIHLENTGKRPATIVAYDAGAIYVPHRRWAEAGPAYFTGLPHCHLPSVTLTPGTDTTIHLTVALILNLDAGGKDAFLALLRASRDLRALFSNLVVKLMDNSGRTYTTEPRLSDTTDTPIAETMLSGPNVGPAKITAFVPVTEGVIRSGIAPAVNFVQRDVEFQKCGSERSSERERP